MKIQGQLETEVYVGAHGDIIIKQSTWCVEDQTVYISPEFAQRIADAITDCIAEAKEARRKHEEAGEE